LKDQHLFAFAGIYDVWTDPKTGKAIEGYSLLTTTPNALVGKVHDRMPVILQKEDEETWLNPDISEPEQLLPLLRQYPPDKMEGWRAPDAARNPRNDYPELTKRGNQLPE
jgi:putative SOS response-associated peptidase YedK